MLRKSGVSHRFTEKIHGALRLGIRTWLSHTFFSHLSLHIFLSILESTEPLWWLTHCFQAYLTPSSSTLVD